VKLLQGQIRAYDTNGNILHCISCHYPMYIVISLLDDIIVQDCDNDNIIIFDTNGKMLRQSEHSTIHQIRGVILTSNGRLVHIDRTHISIFE
jgi:hypothetical protein